jgi:hypothetical protein
MSAGLTAREQEHLAVLRVTAMAADPQAAKVPVRRVDVLALLAAVDRLAQRSTVDAVTVVNGSIPAAFFAGSITVYQRVGYGPEGAPDE